MLKSLHMSKIVCTFANFFDGTVCQVGVYSLRLLSPPVSITITDITKIRIINETTKLFCIFFQLFLI